MSVGSSKVIWQNVIGILTSRFYEEKSGYSMISSDDNISGTFKSTTKRINKEEMSLKFHLSYLKVCLYGDIQNLKPINFRMD